MIYTDQVARNYEDQYIAVCNLICDQFTGRKFTDADLTADLVFLATEYASKYEGNFDFMLDMRATAGTRQGGLSWGQARGVLNCIRADVLRGKVKSTSTATVTQDGMYRDPDTGDIFKVQVAVHGSGNLYAKRLVELDEPKVMKTKTVSHEFVYEPGLLRRIKPEWRMTLEEAKAWGALYGTCCVCGATLTKEASIAAGIGPVCSEKGFWDTDPEVAWYQRNDGWV
jgi:hypothetical protein